MELFEKYHPYFLFDKNEPFDIINVGYKIYRQSSQSVCSGRFISLNDETAFVVEYAVYYDFDIEHMFDLEHVWVFVGKNEKIIRLESSFHGLTLRSDINGYDVIKDETHPCLYVQPGKHAFMPDAKLFNLFPNFKECCNEYSGNGGLLILDSFKNEMFTNEKRQKTIENYIKTNYSFVPSLEYVLHDVPLYKYLPVNSLLLLIPKRINAIIKEKIEV